MKALLCACVAGLLVGCGASGGGAHSASSLEAQRAQAAELNGLRKRNARQASRLQELETQLALAQSGLNQLQAAQDRKDAFKRKTVRIGSGASDAGDASDAEPDPAAPPVDPDPPSSSDDAGPRPVLRLYGRRPRTADSGGDAPVPRVPAGLPPQLPVAPLPDAQAPVPALLATAQGASPSADAQSIEVPRDATQQDPAPDVVQQSPVQQEPAQQDPAVEAYRMALTLVRDRQFEQAEQAFESFLDRYPSHPYANHARYWLGEVLYALRKYPRALETFEQVARQAAERDRAAEAVLKMGLCEKRMGRPDQARALFEKVRKEYPGSVAARLASEEEAS